jgi:hypothetical protein
LCCNFRLVPFELRQGSRVARRPSVRGRWRTSTTTGGFFLRSLMFMIILPVVSIKQTSLTSCIAQRSGDSYALEDGCFTPPLPYA